MPALAQIAKDQPQNVINIARHACFKKSAPAAREEDPVDFVLHELLKPLTVIQHATRQLDAQGLGPAEKALLDKIALSCKTAMQYARATQKASHLSRLLLNTREFRPADLAHEIAEVAQDFAFLNGCTLAVEVSPRVPEVLLAPDDRIAQLLGQFLGQAIKHARGKTVTLTVSGKPAPEGFMAVFRVQTQMPAMSAEAVERVASFQDAHAVIATLFCGRGTGIAACKGQAARIGGRLRLITEGESGVAIELELACKLPAIYAEPLLLV